MVYSPSLEFNLLCLTKRLEDRYTLGGNKSAIWISKGNQKIVLNIKIETPKGAIFAAYFKQKLVDDEEVAAVMTNKKKKITADAVHGVVGHMNDADGRKIMKYLGFDIVRQSMATCRACSKEKAKQRSLPHRTEIIRVETAPKNRVTTVNGRFFLNILSV